MDRKNDGQETSRADPVGPPIRLDSAALVVVDAQQGFHNRCTRAAVRRIAHLVRSWTSAALPVVFTRYHNYPGSKFERLLDWIEVQHAPQTELVEELREFADLAVAVVDKTGYSAFTAQTAKLVAEHGWTDLVFCGLDTDTCVLTSAVDAFEAEHTPWLVRDACASHGGRKHHRTGVTMIGRFIGERQLITSRDVCRRLVGAPHR